MLKDNPELYQLYKDLVVSSVITAEEFWANRGKVCSSQVYSSLLVYHWINDPCFNKNSHYFVKVSCPRTVLGSYADILVT